MRSALVGGLTLVLAACSSTNTSNPPHHDNHDGGTLHHDGAVHDDLDVERHDRDLRHLGTTDGHGDGVLLSFKNISCEMNFNFAPSGQTQVLCLTINPPRSVVLKTDASLTECSGQQCLSNAGENTPILAYGQSITLGPFSCQSSTAGIRCTLQSGAGFLISTSGVTPQGSATVASG